MHLLISFFGVPGAGMPLAALLDLDTDTISFPALPDSGRSVVGIAGLTMDERYIYAAQMLPFASGDGPRHRPSCLIVLDRRDLRLLTTYDFRLGSDLHALMVEGDRLYAVSSGTDELLQLRLDGPRVADERVVWRPDPTGPRTDRHHINDLCRWRGDLVVSGFGLRTGDSWESAERGFVWNVTRDEPITQDLKWPHSPFPVDDRLAVCDTYRTTVRVVVGEPREERLPGLSRGACRLGDRLYVGTSGPRRRSKSTGKPNTTFAERHAQMTCSVAVLDARTFETERVIDLHAHATEIYAIAAVSGTAHWPMLSEVELVHARLRGLQSARVEDLALIEQLQAEVRWRAEVAADHVRTVEALTAENGWQRERLAAQAAAAEAVETERRWREERIAEQDRQLHGLLTERDWRETQVREQAETIANLTRDNDHLRSVADQRAASLDEMTTEVDWRRRTTDAQADQIRLLTDENEWQRQRIEEQAATVAALTAEIDWRRDVMETQSGTIEAMHAEIEWRRGLMEKSADPDESPPARPPSVHASPEPGGKPREPVSRHDDSVDAAAT